MIECFTSDRVHGPCSECGEPTRTAHVTMGSDKPLIYCEAHCPIHKQASMEWNHEPPTESKDAVQAVLPLKGAE